MRLRRSTSAYFDMKPRFSKSNALKSVAPMLSPSFLGAASGKGRIARPRDDVVSCTLSFTFTFYASPSKKCNITSKRGKNIGHEPCHTFNTKNTYKPNTTYYKYLSHSTIAFILRPYFPIDMSCETSPECVDDEKLFVCE